MPITVSSAGSVTVLIATQKNCQVCCFRLWLLKCCRCHLKCKPPLVLGATVDPPTLRGRPAPAAVGGGAALSLDVGRTLDGGSRAGRERQLPGCPLALSLRALGAPSATICWNRPGQRMKQPRVPAQEPCHRLCGSCCLSVSAPCLERHVSPGLSDGHGGSRSSEISESVAPRHFGPGETRRNQRRTYSTKHFLFILY